MYIRKTEPGDLDEVMRIYAHARQFMKEHGNPRQWGSNNWPPQELIENDIKAGKSYVCMENGEIAAVFYYDYGYRTEKSYDEIFDGAWIGEETYGVVHRIASSGKVKGAGSFCIRWAFGQCGHLRIDTHGDNWVMQNCLQGLGFIKCGTIWIENDDDPRIAYEMVKG